MSWWWAWLTRGIVMELDLKLAFKEEFITALLDEGLREDGRSTNQIRAIAINTGSMGVADGSSVVRCGGTSVVCGIRAELANPTEERPDQGHVVISLDMGWGSVTNSNKRRSPVTPSALTQTLQDMLTSSGFVDLKTLCIAAEKLCWVLYVDIVCTSIDGLPLDCALLGIVAALRNVRLPAVTLESGNPVVSLDNRSPLTLGDKPPTCVSFGLNKKWPPLADPDNSEYALCTGTLVVSFVDGKELSGLFKLGGAALTSEDLKGCVKTAKTLCKSHQKLLQSSADTGL